MVPGNALQNMPSRGETRRLRTRIGLDMCSAARVPLDDRAAMTAARAISNRIQRQVMAYAGPSDGRRGRIIRSAANAAVGQFVAVVNQEPVVPGRVDGLFADLGSGVAAEGQPLDAMHAAFDVATHAARQMLGELAEGNRRDESVVRLTHALLAYMDLLMEAVVAGYRREIRRRSRDPHHLRRRLVDLVLGGAHPAQVTSIAGRVGWPLSDRVVIFGTALEAVDGGLSQLPAVALARLEVDRLTVVAPMRAAAGVLDELKGLARCSPVAFTWPVGLADAPSALAWVDRALELYAEQCIPAGDEIDCSRYRFVLLARSDLRLLEHLREDLLRPLRSVPERRRAVLIETLRTWLVAHDGQKEVAARLRVHPNTLDNRIKRLIDLFGPRLIADPDFAASVLLAVSGHGREPNRPAA
jgi:hypothetical protein